MPPIAKSNPTDDLDDWSDEDDAPGIESNVLLGIPNGAIDDETNEHDAAVSRIGGLPALLPKKEPPFTSSHCKACAQPMELLLQIWCPFEDSPMDRALYVWGCARAGCQGKEGRLAIIPHLNIYPPLSLSSLPDLFIFIAFLSMHPVRAFRGLRFNAPYAAKLEKKKAREEERKKRKLELEEKKRKEDEMKKAAAGSNPFSMGANAGVQPFGGGFGLGAQIFGSAPSAVTETPKDSPESHDEQADDVGNSDDDDEASDSDESLIVAMESATVTESPWRKAPFYPAIYLDTIGEELPLERKPTLPKGIKVDDGLDDVKGGKDDQLSWAKEVYEDSLEVDKVFERFATRVKAEPSQCLRYDLNGVPLPFSSTDTAFTKLWPAPPEEPLPVTKPDFKVVRPQSRVYDKRAAGKCEMCGAARVFECQLMPNLINVVRESNRNAAPKMTDDARRRYVEQALKKSGDEKTGMSWGTVMVFSCSNDCMGEDGWSESRVIVQWDD
ncbi:hypothetical protein CVT24_011214 [Panaeolus cyanescens]|uniref:Programmed cell death protein 2 C-terminal domain-containing protein n=1 Tax=Panaeolus cyanescens TaxID=181874 RepID=A0A409VHZ8_9AGAR|nr:hypothetical protein CVT24_011214 [Panaeolus cyanescens]